MSKFRQLPSDLDPCLPFFFLNNKLFTDTDGKRVLSRGSLWLLLQEWFISRFPPSVTSFWTQPLVWNQMKQVLCSIVAVFDYVRLFKSSISEYPIVFDWQHFWVSSIKVDWVRLTNVRVTAPGICPLEFFIILRLKTKTSNGKYDGYRSMLQKE